LVFILRLSDVEPFLLLVLRLSLDPRGVLSIASGAPVAGRARVVLSALLGLRAGAALLGVRVLGLF
jgi:hypothetical protein